MNNSALDNSIPDWAKDLNAFSKDFDMLNQTLKFLKNYLNENSNLGTSPIYFNLENGRGARMVFPHTSAPCEDILFKGKFSKCYNNLKADFVQKPWFVGFFGELQETVEEEVKSGIWKTDDELVNTLYENGRILCYLSAEITKGGNWYNFVFFSGEKGIQDWKSTPCHDRAVRDLSPYFYEKVRIHQGELRLNDFEIFHPVRTLFVDYSTYRRTSTFNRQMRMWRPSIAGKKCNNQQDACTEN